MAISPPPHPAADTRDDPLERYTLRSRAEILFQLRAIQKRKLLVNLDLPGSRQIIVTSVLAVNEQANTVILDSARGDALNHELLSGKGAEFVTQMDGVSISFDTGPVALCEYEKLPALRIALPKALIRLQRREHFRVPMPIVNPVKCIVPPLSPDDPDPIVTHIVDIGCGGVAIAETGGRLGPETGRILADCKLLLPETDAIVTSLEVRNSAQIRLHNGAFQTRLGCKFIKLPNDMAAKLQRFVMNIERARRNTL
ncbi:flagellar brake protein [Thiobacillus sedimenti]|uniref:Flagellar brake protein YcgR n=1 Tax=Thiobacillus sedimenti TaxID=3110231 RepID=A0ABZ1CM34_9PROT|nr:flagellar brake protein [Thiobacillus sp. SCUT-2]WRS40264.1 flagellar brake protein [Thiobacillus sp. SCUT-2]